MIEVPSQDVVPGDVVHVDDVSFDVERVVLETTY